MNFEETWKNPDWNGLNRTPYRGNPSERPQYHNHIQLIKTYQAVLDVVIIMDFSCKIHWQWYPVFVFWRSCLKLSLCCVCMIFKCNMANLSSLWRGTKVRDISVIILICYSLWTVIKSKSLQSLRLVFRCITDR